MAEETLRSRVAQLAQTLMEMATVGAADIDTEEDIAKAREYGAEAKAYLFVAGRLIAILKAPHASA